MTTETLILPPNLKGNAIVAQAIKQSGEAGEAARARLAEEGQKAKMLPKPVGYHMLIAIPEAAETFESGLLKADMTREAEEVMTTVGLVVAMGSDCYADKTKFPTGPWCKVGDFVVVRAYSGTRIAIYGKEWRLISDDTIQAVVDDPRAVSRVQK